MSIIPLRVHSHWSLLAGVPSVEDLVTHTHRLDLPALALADTNALHGVLEFVQRCRAIGLQPIVGVDFTFESSHSLVLSARSTVGYGQRPRLEFSNQI